MSQSAARDDPVRQPERPPTRPSADAAFVSRETGERLDALLDLTQTGEWEWNFATDTIAWSPGLGPLHGRPRGWAPVGYDDFRELVHADDWPSLDRAVRRARSDGVGYELDFRVVFPDGALRWLWTRAEVVPGDGGRLVGVTRDITERRRREDTELFVARASQVLLTRTSADVALQRLCELTASAVVDWCLVQEVAGGAPTAILAVAHRDPELAPLIRAVHEHHTASGNELDLRSAAIRSASTTRVPLQEVGEELIVPVTSEGQGVIALLILGRAKSLGFDIQDIALAEALGRRTGLGLERLRLLEAERRSARRTEALQEVTARLSAAATAEEVLKVAIEDGLAIIGASGGSIAYPDGESVMRRVTAGYAANDASNRWTTVPLDSDLPGPQAARTGVAVWLPDREEAEKRFPLLADVFANTSWRSLCALPLPVGSGRGFLVAFFDESRAFNPDDRAFTEAIITLCTQALERARLLDATARARDVARRLQAVTAAFSAAATPDEVGAAVVDDGLAAVRADAILAYLVAGEELNLVASAGYDERTTAHWASIPLSADVPVTEAVRRSETLVFASPAEVKLRFPLLANVDEPRGARPSIIAPLVSNGVTQGAIAVSFPADHAVDEDDLALVHSFARLSAQAFDRARVLENERVVSDRLGRLQRVTELLGGAMTVNEVAAIVIDQGVAELHGAAGALVLATGDDALETVRSVGYGDQLQALYRRFGPGDPLVAARVFATGRPLWVESLAEMEATYAEQELLLDPHLEAEAIVPLRVAGKTIGVLIVSFEGPRRLEGAEREVLLTLGRQCAQAIANAQVFERDHRIAVELQRALLPGPLVVPQNVTVAVRYLSGSAEADVGGDWYDLVERPDGRLGGSVGDVAGKGVLAASRMGQLRTAQRAHSLEGLSPAAVVSRINTLVEATESFLATVVAFDLDPASGDLRYCIAGHLPPVLLEANGRSRFVRGGESMPLGVGPDTSFAEGQIRLEPGDAIIFYTDGLVERPRVGLDDALERLRRSLEGRVGESVEHLLEHLLATLVGEPALTGRAALHDDVALLGLQRFRR